MYMHYLSHALDIFSRFCLGLSYRHAREFFELVPYRKLFFFFLNSTLKRKDYLLVCCGWFAEASSSVEQETVCPYSLTHYEKVL